MVGNTRGSARNTQVEYTRVSYSALVGCEGLVFVVKRECISSILMFVDFKTPFLCVVN